MDDTHFFTQLKTSISNASASFGLNLGLDEIKIEHPTNSDFGDYSANIALTSFKDAKKQNGESFANPREFATELQKELEKQPIQADNVAGPGFLNFKIPTQELLQHVEVINAEQNFLSQPLENKRITIEFTDPNPFKEFHIGHLYSNSVGEAISRLLETSGATIRRVCYQGDVGLHVAKAIWGIIELAKNENKEGFAKLNELQPLSISERIQFLGKAYSIGATAYEDTPSAQEEIKILNKQIFTKDATMTPLYELGRKWSLEYFETIYQRLGTQFEAYYFESNVSDKGIEIVQENLQKGIFEESQGAVIFPGSKHGLHDRVFINSLGLPTYEAKELALAPTKYEDWPYDLSIIITGNEINEYFKVLLKAMSLIKPELAEKTKHLSHGMVRLPEGKMSSRTGNVLTAEWLLDEAKQMIRGIIDKNRSDMPISEKENISEVVAVSAVKYALLKSSVGSDITFNFDESVSFEGNSGPYIQYTYARCKSVLRKVEGQSFSNSNVEAAQLEKEELLVLRMLYQFDEVIQRAASEYSPHHVCTYLFELAQTFNTFYNNVQIIKAEDETQKKFRLQLTKATSLILQKGLHVLGIKTVEQM